MPKLKAQEFQDRITDDQVAEFDRRGFLGGLPVLAAGEVEELRAELDRIIATGPTGFAPGEPRPAAIRNIGNSSQPIHQVVNIWQASAAFRRLAFHPLIVTTISRLARCPDLILYHDQVVNKPAAHGGVVQWHQDAPYWMEIRPPTPVSAWVALDEVAEDNGAMWMVPGSHRWGDAQAMLRSLPIEHFYTPSAGGFQPPREAPIQEIVAQPRPVPLGHVHFHHSWMWHGSPANQSNRSRRAIAIHYVPPTSQFYRSKAGSVGHLTTAADGTLASHLGEAFPWVCRAGTPVAAW